MDNNQNNNQNNQPIDIFNQPKSQPAEPAASSNQQKIDQLKNSINIQASTNPSPSIPPTDTSQTPNPFIKILANPRVIIAAVSTLAVLIIIAVLYYFLAYNQGSFTASFDIIPDSITINNENYNPATDLSLNFKPGTYTLIAEKQNFFPLQTSFTIQPQQTTQLNLTFDPLPQPENIIEFNTLFPHLNPQETEITYLSNQGTTFYRANLNDFSKDIISPNTFNHITDIIWAPTARNACIIKAVNDPETIDFQSENILYQSDRTPQETIFHFYDFSKYDLTSQNHIVYPPEVKNPSWHPSKEKIIFHYFNQQTGENSISQANPNLENRELIFELNEMQNAVSRYSPDTEYIAVVDQNNISGQSNPIYIYNVLRRELDKIPTKDNYADFIWSPDSQKLIGIKSDNTTSQIDINSLQTIDLPFSSDLSHLAWLNNGYQFITVVSPSPDNQSLVLYDTTTNQTQDLAFNSASPLTNINNLFVDQNDQTVYFTAGEKNYLYSLSVITRNNNEATLLQ